MASIKLDRPKLSEHAWFRHCYDADLWAEELGEGPPAWLIHETRRLGARTVQRWLCDESVPFRDYDAGLWVAEIAGVA